MDNGTVKTVGIVFVVLGALLAAFGGFVPDIEIGGSASGGGGAAEGGISMGFGGLLWVGLALMAVGLVLTLAPMFAPADEGRSQPPTEE